MESKLLQILKTSELSDQAKIIDLLLGFVNQAILPAVNNQLTNISLLGAHVLGGLSQETDIIGTLTTLFGKRELKDFWTDFGNSLLGIVIDGANGLLAPLTLTAAQLLAQFGLSGGIGPIGREVKEFLKTEYKDFWTDLGNSLLGIVIDGANGLLAPLTLTAAQLLAQFGLSGGIGPIGRDIDQAKFLDAILDTLLDFVNQAILPAVNNQLTNISLLGAHVLGGLSQENDIIGTITTLFGKRELKDFWTDLGNSLLGIVIDGANGLLAPLTLTAAQLLAQIGLSGGIAPIGRDIIDQAKFWDAILNTLIDFTNQAILPAVNNQLTNISLLGAHVLGGLSQENDIIGTLTTLFGK